MRQSCINVKRHFKFEKILILCKFPAILCISFWFYTTLYLLEIAKNEKHFFTYLYPVKNLYSSYASSLKFSCVKEFIFFRFSLCAGKTFILTYLKSNSYFIRKYLNFLCILNINCKVLLHLFPVNCNKIYHMQN
ncbi:hypothetical protein EDEG_01654 [Edhazardia aedis USNM 41457]|uniref:Uncharacterized protein n=1 Tax=Edhazardia aedis (strain USNM 41457) TaxID=1003232 RepID=J8ZWQ1_EDHAE|nr:hypothetical protein EDEG_01654 [Edhazardia aedis USNM 41457]|eukprot:EJW04078.1 hypothetical protein EDEG_01654 [Edhazardia aedis USNM 41457]